MKTGWLINDTLTCIPNTKTFWHDLLENISGLKDMTFGHTPFPTLAEKIELCLKTEINPDYIIRNATFFRPIETEIPQICLLQDFYNYEHFMSEQIKVIDSCAMTVINSPFIYNQVITYLKGKKVKMIPMGVDFNFFDPDKHLYEPQDLLPNSILFVGAATIWPKGFDTLMKVVDNTNYNFVFVMKDDFKTDHPRIKVFNRINQTHLRSIMKQCRMTICTSQMETFHLGGIESCAMNLPLVTTNVGIYNSLEENGWGLKCDTENIVEKIDFMFNNINTFSPRQTMLEHKLDKIQCMNSWKQLIEEIID